MAMDEEDSATPFSVYMFDCPRCGGRTEIGDQDPSSEEDCWDCGATIVMNQ